MHRELASALLVRCGRVGARQRARPRLGGAGSRQIREQCGNGVFPASIRPLDAGGRAADVRRGSAAAHTGRGDGGSADPRQAFAGRLAKASRAEPVAAGERFDMGPDAHGEAHADRRRCRGRSGLVVRARSRARRRAGGPRRPAPGDENHGGAVRDGAHHRRSAGAEPLRRKFAVSIFVRHARRILLERCGRCALSIGVRRRHRRDRPRARVRRRRVRAAEHFGQAVGAAPAL